MNERRRGVVDGVEVEVEEEEGVQQVAEIVIKVYDEKSPVIEFKVLGEGLVAVTPRMMQMVRGTLRLAYRRYIANMARADEAGKIVDRLHKIGVSAASADDNQSSESEESEE